MSLEKAIEEIENYEKTKLFAEHLIILYKKMEDASVKIQEDCSVSRSIFEGGYRECS